MSAVGYLTSSSLIEQIKRIGFFPTSQNTFTDSDLLALANQEIRVGILPSILQYHEEYFARDSDPIAIEENKSNYAIPYRATGGKFRAVFYMDSNGQLRSMTRIQAEDRPYYQQSNFQNRFVYFFLEGNEVVLVPDVATDVTGSLVFSYYLRPNELVDESRVSTILSKTIGATETVFTVDNVPSGLTAFVRDGITLTGFSTSAKLDILQIRPGHKTIDLDVSPTAVDVSAKTITFSNDDISTSMIVGDYVAFAGECIVPQVPADLHDVLAHRVAMRCMQSMGDAQNYQVAASKLVEMEKYTATLVDNRAEGEPQKANNLRGVLRSNRLRKRGWL